MGCITYVCIVDYLFKQKYFPIPLGFHQLFLLVQLVSSMQPQCVYGRCQAHSGMLLAKTVSDLEGGSVA